jgi:hypothetical protein
MTKPRPSGAFFIRASDGTREPITITVTGEKLPGKSSTLMDMELLLALPQKLLL